MDRGASDGTLTAERVSQKVAARRTVSRARPNLRVFLVNLYATLLTKGNLTHVGECWEEGSKPAKVLAGFQPHYSQGDRN